MAIVSVLTMGYGALFDRWYVPVGEWFTVLYFINYFIFIGVNNPFYESIHAYGKLVSK